MVTRINAILIIMGIIIIKIAIQSIVINITVFIIIVSFIAIQIRQTCLLRKVMRKPKPMKTITCTS